MLKDLQKPPKITSWLLEKILKYSIRYGAIGDLTEKYAFIVNNRGKIIANFWFRWQLIQLLPSYINFRFFGGFIMFKNYFKTAVRNFNRNKGFSILNITGLTVGMTCSLIIFLWLYDEWSYDRFHENADNIYRIILFDNQMSDKGFAVSPAAMGKTLKDEYPEITHFTRFIPIRTLLRYMDKSFYESGCIIDPDFFEIFSFKIIKGSKQALFDNIYSIIISEETANKYFGNENPLGKTLTIFNRDFQVSGIIENVPENSHLQFDYILPVNLYEKLEQRLDNWKDISYFTYIMVQKNTDSESIEKKANECLLRNLPEKKITTYFQSLKDIHLKSNYNFDIPGHGNINDVYILLCTSVFILTIAVINFINISTAKSSVRAKEIGLRKVMGASKHEIIKQFFSESLILTSTALIISIIFVALLLPVYNNLTGKETEIDIFLNPQIISGLIAIGIFTGIISAIYPSIILSSFKPVNTVKGVFSKSKKSAVFLRRGLVTIQFMLSIVLLISSSIAFKQLKFMNTKNLGYDKNNIISFPMRGRIFRNYLQFKDELLSHTGIVNVSATANLPIIEQSGGSIKDWEGKKENQNVHTKILWVDPDYKDTFKLNMSYGRFFSSDFPTDKTAFVLNETAVKRMQLTSPVGSKITARDQTGPIIGVVKDFHFLSLHTKIDPLLMIYRPNRFRNICIRINPVSGDVDSIITFLESKWKQFAGNYSFTYDFLDDRINGLYINDRKICELFSYFTILTFFIACIGLFSLASYMAERRVREIGIRKVLGASTMSIIRLLNTEFLMLTVIANSIAWPAGWFLANKWLQNFSYKTNIDFLIFISAGIFVTLVSLITVSYQTIKAAHANPIDSIRYE